MARSRSAALAPALALVLGAGLVATAPARADQHRPEPVTEVRPAAPPRGRPTVVLDRLTMPPVLDQHHYERHLRAALAREARRADWGAGRGRRIEYRFSVDELELALNGSILRVSCRASGALPKGRKAQTRISFGGHIGDRKRLIEEVLGIVARGIVTRLAELERVRRGELRRLRVATATGSE